MDDKGRQPKGEMHCNAILTNEQIQMIKDEYEYDGTTQQELANKYGTHRTNISRIVNGNRWNHIT